MRGGRVFRERSNLFWKNQSFCLPKETVLSLTDEWPEVLNAATLRKLSAAGGNKAEQFDNHVFSLKHLNWPRIHGKELRRFMQRIHLDVFLKFVSLIYAIVKVCLYETNLRGWVVQKYIAAVFLFLPTGLLYWAHNCIEGSLYYEIKNII